MKINKTLIILSLLLILCISLGAVSAADISVNDVDGVNNTQNIGISQDSSQNLENAQSSGIQDDSSQKIVKLTSLQEDPAPLNELRSEIMSAGPGATIKLTKNYKAQNEREQISIDKSLTIDGQGHTIDGTNSSKIFQVNSDNVIIKNINFINTKSSMGGGAISWDGVNGCVSGCSFINCSASMNGGAIYWLGSDNGVVSGCSFINCSASMNGGAISWVYSDNGVVSGCSFINCSASSDGGAIYWLFSVGSVNYNVFEGNVADYGDAISIDGSLDCDYNFFGFENTVTTFPTNLIDDVTPNNWVVLNISKANSLYSVNFICNNGSTLTEFMPDYIASLNIDGDVKDITIKNNTFNDNPISGDYLLTSINSGNTLARATLNWNTTSYNISTTNCTYGETATVTVKVNPSATGNITVKTDDGRIFSEIIDKGVVTISLSNLNAGVHNLSISYSGDNNYLPFNASTNLTVHGLNGSFDITVKDIVYGDSFIINITNAAGVNDEKLSGIAKVNINGIVYDVNVTDGSGCKVVDDVLSVGKYDVNASLTVHNYNVMNSNNSFVVNKIGTVLSVSTENITYGESVVFNVTLNDMNGKVVPSGKFAIFVNGTRRVTAPISAGKGCVAFSGWSAGVYNIAVVYDGDGNYSSSNASTSLTVLNATGSFNITVKDIVYGDGFIIDVANATGVNGALLNGIVDVSVNGKVYSFNVTDGEGSYEVSDILPAGKYVVNASLTVPNYDVMVNNTGFVVSKALTKFIDATNGTVYNGNYYSVRLVDNFGNALASKNVAIKIAGKTYNVKTDKNGLAKVKLAITSKYLNKALTVTYKFSGDNNLKASSGSSEIKVIKTPTKLVNATKLVVKNHKNFYVKLTTKSGKVLANKVITMKSSVSGKIYKMKTNSKGIAKIDLWVKKQPLGKYYKYTFKYAGSSYYNSCTKTFKIKIIK